MNRKMRQTKVALSTRVNPVDLSTAIRYMLERGMAPKSRSESIDMCVRLVADVAEANGIEPYETWEDADRFLEKLDMGFKHSASPRIRKEFIRGLAQNSFNHTLYEEETEDKLDDLWKKLDTKKSVESKVLGKTPGTFVDPND